MSEYLFSFCLSQIMENCTETSAQRIRKRKKRIYRNLILLKLMHYRNLNTVPKPQTLNIIREYPSDVFHSHFHMNKTAFAKLLEYVDPLWRNSWTGRPPINSEISLYITIWRLTHRSAMRELSKIFSIGTGSVHRMVTKMTRVLTSLKTKFIKWPQSNEEYLKLIKGFQNIKSNHSFPNVVGCLGSTHLAIFQPKTGASSYYNRNKTYSMILQGICNSDYQFTNIYFGWPGGSDNANMWKSNPLYKKLHQKSIIISYDGHILGDATFPLETFLMVPFRDNTNLSDEKTQFNETLNTIRVTIEKAFGVLKKNFPILKHLPVTKLEEAKYIVSSCVMLHNFIIEMEGISIPDLDDLENDEITSPPLEDYNLNKAADIKRDKLLNLFRA